jgi:hypothetical protein
MRRAARPDAGLVEWEAAHDLVESRMRVASVEQFNEVFP